MWTILLILMLAVVGVLLAGVFLMMRGGELNKKYGNKLMVARVALQGVAVLLIGLMFMFSSHGK